MANQHKRLNHIIKLYPFFTNFNFYVGKAGTGEEQEVKSRKLPGEIRGRFHGPRKAKGKARRAEDEGRSPKFEVAWHFLARFGTIWHRFFARAGKLVQRKDAKVQRHLREVEG